MNNVRQLIGISSLCGLLCCEVNADPGTQHLPWFSSGSKVEAGAITLPATIRVGLMRSRHNIIIGGTGKYNYIGSKKNKSVTMSGKDLLRIKGSQQGLLMGKSILGNTLVVTPAATDAFVTVNGRAYRGTILLKSHGSGSVDVIEKVSLEEYLYGVLPREVGVDWPADSLKSQAVVSRTFVVANLGKYADRGYDVSSDVFSQVYGGREDESPSANQAVDATQGEILVDAQGAPIQAFFHSSCGGHTENPAYVWRDMQNPPDYLEGIRDSYCKEDPYFQWHLDISADSIRKRLRRHGIKVGSLQKISIEKRSPSGRAWVFRLDSTQGRKSVPGNVFRLALGPDILRSTLISDIERKGKNFHFEGSGWGHGVGLCQWGARGRALAGDSYEKILSAYYPHTHLIKTQETAVLPANK